MDSFSQDDRGPGDFQGETFGSGNGLVVGVVLSQDLSKKGSAFREILLELLGSNLQRVFLVEGPKRYWRF